MCANKSSQAKSIVTTFLSVWYVCGTIRRIYTSGPLWPPHKSYCESVKPGSLNGPFQTFQLNAAKPAFPICAQHKITPRLCNNTLRKKTLGGEQWKGLMRKKERYLYGRAHCWMLLAVSAFGLRQASFKDEKGKNESWKLGITVKSIVSGKKKSSFRGIVAQGWNILHFDKTIHHIAKHSMLILTIWLLTTYSIRLIPPTVQNSKTLRIRLNKKGK